MAKLLKTKFPSVYYKEDTQTKVRTYIVRIKIVGIIDTEQIIGYSNDAIRKPYFSISEAYRAY